MLNVSFCCSANTGESPYRRPKENVTWVRPYLFSSGHVLLILLRWFARWEISGRTVPILKAAACGIYSEQHVTSLYCILLVSSPGILLKSKWWDHTVVPTQAQLGKIPFLFQNKNAIFICSFAPLYLWLCFFSRWDLSTEVRGSLNKFPDLFRIGTFIESTHMKLKSPLK